MKSKTKFLQIKVSEEQKGKITELAESAGTTITDYCLSKILNIPLTETKPVKYIVEKYVTREYTPKRKRKLQKA